MGWDGSTAAADGSDSLPDPLDHLEAHIAWRGRALLNPAGYRVAQRQAVLAAAAAGDDLEAAWPTRHPASLTTTAPDHLPGSGRLGAQRTEATSTLVATTDRGAAVVDIDALHRSAG